METADGLAALAGAALEPSLKTVVYQSYRTHNVAPWISRCMKSVRDWTVSRGFEYRFIDDRFFDYVPDWYRQGAGGNVQVVTNLARLAVAGDLLSNGYDRTIWLDADMLIFDPHAFEIDVREQFAFCREVWLTTRWGATVKMPGVNNSATVFLAGNSFLDYAIWAHEDLVRRGTQILPHGTTTRLLTGLHAAAPMPLLHNIGLLSPVIARDILEGEHRLVVEYALAHGAPIHAANLGASVRGEVSEAGVFDDNDFAAIADTLLRTRGAIFNDAHRERLVAR
jgi:hypothetical protein